MLFNFVIIIFIIMLTFIFVIISFSNYILKKKKNNEKESKQSLNKEFNFNPIFNEINNNTNGLCFLSFDVFDCYEINLKYIKNTYCNIYNKNIWYDNNFLYISSKILKSNYFDNHNLLFNNDNINNILELEALFKVLLKEINTFNKNNFNAIYYYVQNKKNLLNNNQIKIIEEIQQQFYKLLNKLLIALTSAKINSNNKIEHNNEQLLLTIEKTNEIIDKLDKRVN